MATMSNRWRRLGTLQQDTLIAVGLTLLGWAQAFVVRAFFGEPHGGFPGGGVGGPRPTFPFGEPVPELSLVSFVLIALCFMPLALRRRWPIPVAIVVSALVALYDAMRLPPVMTVFAVILAVYTVGTVYARGPLVWTSLGSVAILLLGTLPQWGSGRWIANAFGTVGTIVAAAAFGDATRNRRNYVAEVEQRAIDAERTREEEALRRVDEERLRIARELHDVTAHSLSIIAVQSGAAERVVESDPAAARRALASIRSTAKSSLDELRAVLGVLRHADDGTPLAPAPSLGQIEQLATAVREAGVEVRLTTQDLELVPSVTQASAYRVVQEALTNVVRHAGATQADVSLVARNDLLVIDVVDDGRGATTTEGGHGIAGMRERVSALGGTFRAGAAAGGGFVVHAEFPLPRRQ